jgi:hypothetical protein
MEVCFSEQDYLDEIELHHLTPFHLIFISLENSVLIE